MVYICIGCGQLPCVHRGEVVPDTMGAELLPSLGVCPLFEVNGSHLGISPALSDVQSYKKANVYGSLWGPH